MVVVGEVLDGEAGVAEIIMVRDAVPRRDAPRDYALNEALNALKALALRTPEAGTKKSQP